MVFYLALSTDFCLCRGVSIGGAPPGESDIVPKCSEIGLERSLRLDDDDFSSLNGIDGELGIPIVERGLRGGFS